MAYDKAKWHYEGNYPDDLPPENGGTHIGFFLAWAVLHDMAGEELIDDAAALLDAVRRRETTGRDLLFRELDGMLIDEDLNAQGNAFAGWYYKKHYLGDYDRVMAGRYATPYHATDDWATYDLVGSIIDKRYEEWLRRRKAKRKPGAAKTKSRAKPAKATKSAKAKIRKPAKAKSAKSVKAAKSKAKGRSRR